MSNKNMTTASFVKSKTTPLRERILTPVTYRRDEFFKALKKVFHDEHGENLPIYGVVRNTINKIKLIL